MLNISAEHRLQALFPHTTSSDLVGPLRHSTSGQAAINRLIAQGYLITEY